MRASVYFQRRWHIKTKGNGGEESSILRRRAFCREEMGRVGVELTSIHVAGTKR